MPNPDDQLRARQLEPLSQDLAELILRALVHRVDPSTPRQRLQIQALADDVESDVEHIQPYGLHTVPRGPTNGSYAEAIRVQLGADGEYAAVILVTDMRSRPTGWDEGDSGLYDHRGHIIRNRAGGVTVTSPDDVDIDAAGDVLLGSGATRGVARTQDQVQASGGIGGTDAAFFTWVAAVSAATAVAPVPASLISKVTGGSATVKAKD